MDLTNSPGHLNHQFAAEDAATLRPATEMTPNDMNGPMNELVNIILAAQIVPDANNHAQVLAALQALFLKRDGDTGLIRTITPAGGGRVRELGDIANAATVGGIEIGISYNCNIDLVTGVWAGRDAADICWLEKWSDAGGVKEFWCAPTAAVGVVPVWKKIFYIDAVNGSTSFGNPFWQQVTRTAGVTYYNTSDRVKKFQLWGCSTVADGGVVVTVTPPNGSAQHSVTARGYGTGNTFYTPEVTLEPGCYYSFAAIGFTLQGAVETL